MDKMKQWVALTVVGVLAVMAAGWFLLISPKRTEATSIRDETVAKQSANGALRTQLAMLKALAKDEPRQRARLAAVAAKIPDNPALPALIRALSGAAKDASVELVSMAPAAPAAYTGATASGAQAPTVPAATRRTSTAGAAAAAAAAAAVPAMQVINLTITVSGGYFQVERFFDRVESLTRALKVTGFSLEPGDNPVLVKAATASGPSASDTGRNLIGTISGQVFMQDAAPTTAATAPTTAR
jgi:type IV pilus assembly protein PilO